MVFPISAFERYFSKPPKINDTVFNETFAFKYKVLNFSNETVIAEMVLKEGEEYTLPNTEWKSKVAKIAKDDVMFYQEPAENQTMDTPFGKAVINMTKSRMFVNFVPELYRVFNKTVDLGGGFAMPQKFQVTEIHDGDFLITRYGSLADKKLKLTADLVKRVPNVKEVKSTKPLVTEVGDGTQN